VLPQAAHPRQVVVELRELDLELALGADGMLGEDVEDQLRAVDDPRRKLVLERALLHRAELVVDEQDVRLRGRIRLLQLGELALADVGARIGPGPVLHHRPERLDPGRARQLLELGQLVLGGYPLGQHRDDEPALGLGPGRRVGLMCRHASIMPARREDSIRRTASSSRASGTVSEMRKNPSPLGP